MMPSKRHSLLAWAIPTQDHYWAIQNAFRNRATRHYAHGHAPERSVKSTAYAPLEPHMSGYFVVAVTFTVKAPGTGSEGHCD